jgi:hypothetical protein
MKLCIVGIGGCGGNVSEKILANQDVPFSGLCMGDHICFGDIKGIWIEADPKETKKLKSFKPFQPDVRDYHPFYFIPMESLSSESETSKIMQQKYGYDLKKQGFHRQAEFLKAVFEIFDMDRDLKETSLKEYRFDNPILRSTWNCIRPYTTMAEGGSSDKCDGILFVVSLGGGTGTGFINPITKYIKAERSEFPVFVLAVLTEKGMDEQQKASEYKRNMGAVISMYDLLGKKKGQGVDGLVLVDNQILVDRFGGRNFTRMDQHISQAIRPMLAARSYPGEDTTSLPVKTVFLENMDFPPILVPCYSHGSIRISEESLVAAALKEGGLSENGDGRLFGCDPKLADRAFVFARGFLSSEKLEDSVSKWTGLDNGRIHTWRTLSDTSNEVLILLRNPYGSKDAYKIKGTLENRTHCIMTNALAYMNQSKDEIISSDKLKRTSDALESYFYGKEGMAEKIKEAMVKMEGGEKPFFKDELRIFGSSQFCINDIKDPKGLSRKFIDAKDPLDDPLSCYIAGTMDEGLKERINASSKDEVVKDGTENIDLTLGLVDMLNDLLQDTSLYDSERFAKVKLTKETESLVKGKHNLDDEGLMHLNRLLLEEAYYQELASIEPHTGLMGEEQIRPIVEKLLKEKGLI